MRTDWVPISASALVVGMMALVFGALLNPLSGADDQAQTMSVVTESGGRWLGMSVMYFVASVALTLGLPSILTLFRWRGRRLGAAAVAVFLVGVMGTAGYAMLLVFFRALARKATISEQTLAEVVDDIGLSIFLYGWIVAFFLGLAMIGVALLLSRRTPVWVPIVLLCSVAMFPLASEFGRVVQVLQLFAMAVAFTGIAIATVGLGASSRGPVIGTSQSSGSTSGTNA